jgi:hypothetical protein
MVMQEQPRRRRLRDMIQETLDNSLLMNELSSVAIDASAKAIAMASARWSTFPVPRRWSP